MQPKPNLLDSLKSLKDPRRKHGQRYPFKPLK
ncbi:MAG: transposase family protein [Paludibacter sp.]|nr:transposase family protein [Paludibacter sp.]